MTPLLTLLSPAGRRARLSTLIFHRVLVEPDALFPHELHARRFDSICSWLARDFNVLPLDRAVRLLKEGRLPARAAAITFDDGYADNESIAMPILQRHGLHATFFIASGFLDGGRMWNDTVIEAVRATRSDSLDLTGLGVQGLGIVSAATVPERSAAIDQIVKTVKYLPPAERLQVVERIARVAAVELSTDLMMRSDQVQSLAAAGMGIGGHTMSHPILAGLAAQEVHAEVDGNRRRLQALAQREITLFAYPNGRPGQDYDESTVAHVRGMKFEAAVSTAWGTSDSTTDLFQLPRFTPWDQTRLRFGLRMARNLTVRAHQLKAAQPDRGTGQRARA